MPTNALIHEKSPYLKQHAHNPVDWLPWGTEAFEKARSENKPIFLSIGYSTCHWCHVMAHESFENESVAAVLNRDFIPVKLDREERPDVDRIYMLFVQATTGSGGWPMSVWLTPDLKPFFGGTYFPPDSRWGRPGFRDLLEQLAKAWKQDRKKIEESGSSVAEQLRSISASAKSAAEPDRALFDSAFRQFQRAFDSKWGGFGGAPKFPRPVALNYLFRYFSLNKDEEALDMAAQTLASMAAGGMHDQLGGGFHRYSVDEHWFVPHFEKMLYDQAQLVVSYLEAYQATGEEAFASAARDILSYVHRDLEDTAGGFYSAEDADSPDPEDPSHSGEGAFYIWRESEIRQLLGEDAELFCFYYGVKEYGNVEHDPHGEFTGRNILYIASALENAGRRFAIPAAQAMESLARSRSILLQARSIRPRPHLDNKVLTSWNSLMISALAKAYVTLGDQAYLDQAKQATDFLLCAMFNSETGQLLRRYCEGEAAVSGFADDYAFFAQALLDLFEATSDPIYLTKCIDVVRRGLLRFEDAQEGGFFSTLPGTPDLLLRMKDDYDGAEPSANSVATDLLLRLAHLTGNDEFSQSAEKSIRAFAPKLKAQPTSAPQMMVAVGRYLAEPEQIIVRTEVIDDAARAVAAGRSREFNPYRTVLCLSDEAVTGLAQTAPFLGSLKRQGAISVFHCRNYACDLPEVIEESPNHAVS